MTKALAFVPHVRPLSAVLSVTLPKNLQILPSSPSKPSRRSMQLPYRYPTLPALPVRKGVRGRRPKSETLALLKAVAEAAASHNGAVPDDSPLVPRVHKKRGPKSGSKVSKTGITSPHLILRCFYGI